MGELLDMTQRLAAKRQAVVTEPDVLFPHIAAVYDPLQRITARTLYSPLG